MNYGSDRPGSVTGNQLWEIKCSLNRIGKNLPRDAFDLSAKGAYELVGFLRQNDRERRRGALAPVNRGTTAPESAISEAVRRIYEGAA